MTPLVFCILTNTRQPVFSSHFFAGVGTKPNLVGVGQLSGQFRNRRSRIGITLGSRALGIQVILKQLRLSRHLSQEQLAEMSGLNVRTIQRIESGHNASLETLKSLASVFEVDAATLTQEKFVIDKGSNDWQSLPLWLKVWFFFNFLSLRPTRSSATRIEVVSHASGFLFCALGLLSEAALVGGLIMLANAYLFHLLTRQGDKHGIWYEAVDVNDTNLSR